MKKVEVAGHGDLLLTSADFQETLSLPADTMIEADVFLRIIGHVNSLYPGGRLAYDIEYKHFSVGQINMLGALGQLVHVSPTLENVSEAFYKYYGRYNTIFIPGVERRGEFVASKIDAAAPGLWSDRAFQVTVEMFLYGMVRIVKEWFSDPLANPITLTFPYQMPELERAMMAETIGVEPMIGDSCHLLFRSEVFQKPLPYANPQLWEHLKQYLEQNAQHQSESLSSQLAQYLKERIKNTPDVKTAADHFSLSERSLQRRLKGENSTFQQVLDKVRLDLASQLLRNELFGLKEIAFHCGFSDPNSFFRAFRKWTGKTPEGWKADQ